MTTFTPIEAGKGLKGAEQGVRVQAQHHACMPHSSTILCIGSSDLLYLLSSADYVSRPPLCSGRKPGATPYPFAVLEEDVTGAACQPLPQPRCHLLHPQRDLREWGHDDGEKGQKGGGPRKAQFVIHCPTRVSHQKPWTT